MPDYDVVLIHPPAVYDFRKRALFPGALGVSVEQVQFTKPPIGMLSIAEYLDRHGYKVILDNLGDRMVNSPDFNAEEHIRNLEARVYAVGMHFQQHSQGAVEIANICKHFHPNAIVLVGGLTATRFHEEVIREYPFIDAVIRAEAEKPFLELMRSLDANGKLTDTPNLTYRAGGEVRVTPLMAASQDIDEFDPTRLDLMEPKTSVYPANAEPRWSLEVGRGCTFTCNICGGSAYSYRTYLGMSKPAMRSPGKIIEDIRSLNRQGITFIGLYQDPRMGGEAYWRELMAKLRDERLEIGRLSLDLLSPADEDFIKAVAATRRPVVFHICPDTGSDAVRKAMGRHYTNDELLATIELAHSYGIPVTTFFSAGLAGETRESLEETKELWKKLIALDEKSMMNGSLGNVSKDIPLGGPIMGPIVLDPGSLAFDNPEQHGYKVRYKSLKHYIAALSKPSWHQWMNYETDQLSIEQLVYAILDMNDFVIDQREKYKMYDLETAYVERVKVETDRAAIQAVEMLEELPDGPEKEARLKVVRNKIDELLDNPPPPLSQFEE